MKTFIITLLVVCVAIIAGAIVYLDHQKSQPAPKPVAETPASQPDEPASPENVPAPSPHPAVAPTPAAPAQVMAAATITNQAAADSASPLHKKVKALLSAKSGAEKHALFEELRKDGQLDAAIADLKQMAADNPSDPEIPTTIGEAELNEIRALNEAGSDNKDQMGILAMEADQEFNAALQIDPKNWEAQFIKASSMYYWPANPQMDNQVVQNLTSLIDQQETMPANPDYAQAYVVLGNEYQKIGQPDKAQATWQLGAQEYPGDATLEKKLAGQ